MPRRLQSIDWARGVAVLLMMEAHAFDAWTRAADRGTIGFRNATILGGFAAPVFLMLAGMSVPLAIARAGRTAWSAAEGVVKRGLEIFLLAFLFRLQAFVVSPGSHPIFLFRVDILNIMGPAIVATALLMAALRSDITRVVTLGAVALGLAMATPIVRATPLVHVLPVWIQWYIRPAGEYTNFTLFPWAGFVFAGAAAGVLISRSWAVTNSGSAPSAVIVRTAVIGAALIASGWYASTRPSIYADSSFWTSSPTWFAIRTGIVLCGLAALAAAERRPLVATALGPIALLGRHSLFVYWIHVELVYGYASWLWKGRLPIWGTTLAYLAFCAAIYIVVRWKDGLPRTSRTGPARRREPQMATA